MEQKKKLDELSTIHPRITFPRANLDPRLRSHFWRPFNYAGSVALVAIGSLWQLWTFRCPTRPLDDFCGSSCLQSFENDHHVDLMLRNFGMKLIHWIEFLVFNYYICVWMILRCVQLWCGSRYFLHLKTPANFPSPPVTEVSPVEIHRLFLGAYKRWANGSELYLGAAWCKHLARCTSLKCSLQSWLVLVFLGGLF